MKRRRVIAIVLIAVGGVVIYAVMPRARAWPRGAWDAADHNRDGILTREEMRLFGEQAEHRNGPRLLMHFDAADTDGNPIVDAAEIEAYGTNIGSHDRLDHLPPPHLPPPQPAP